MLKKKLVFEIDNLLEKYQFHKIGMVWNRESGDFIDVLDVQVGKSGEKFTINVGVAEKSVLGSCWGSDSLRLVEESSCTIRARLGELMCGRDVWWPLTSEDGVNEVLDAIENTAIPFLHLNHSVDRMIEFLENNSSARIYPPEAIYLALLYRRAGNIDRSVKLLKTLQIELNGGWREKISEILNKNG